ncbi:MMPL family transporter [Actinoplanes sp. KI2]|uniref:MMPL family transporter n=1 Tax=Actinoplanes sp. KI2 TaxID=2983315 RepID=UPI0021D5B51A|nr:MMPL family transporter [Actinoplanes sp. KI2]MCU7722655.1 MMPL family transporter [Actinoplanes sp. KI2]
MVFAGWGSWVARFRWPVLIVALVAVMSSGIWGLGVFGQLTEGGYNDPNSESTHAARLVTDTFGAQGGDLVVIYTPAKGKIDDPQLAKRVQDSLGKLPKSAVTGTVSYWSAKSAQYAAKDKSSAVAVITLAGEGDAAKLDSYRAIDDKFAVDGAKVQLSGAVTLADASSARSTKDLGRAEAISLPITLVLLVLIFGSLVAASLPVLVGGAAVLGSLGILHAISAGTDVNSFAVNVASLLGLGMAIDYGLFIVGRFREELADGRTPSEAVSRTVGTAGRTVVFSATLLMIALAGLLLFPQGFLNSLAYGGLAAVFLAALLSLTLLPAVLAALGPRVDKLPVRLPRRAGAGEPGSGWAKLAGVVLRHPVVVAVPILLILVLFASPIHGVRFGENDERILPAGDPSRQAIETLKADYPQFTGDSVQVVLRGAQDTAGFAVQLRQIPGISQIGAARKDKGVTLFTATLEAKDAYGSGARDVVDAIRALPVPAGAQLLVGGTTARNVDSLEATADRLPWMVAMLVGATLLLMFLAFGSVLLPIKAVLMSALSLGATFGLLVWIFQQGHGASLLDITPAPLEVGVVVLMAAVVFGLSTDYEVFLLSRMVEARTRGASTNEAVTTGLARTGRVISAAALLLIVVTGAFALSSVTSMRFVGVGMIIALLLDATVVRMLLVPAVLRLLGDAAWWAPGPLRRLQERAGLAEYETPLSEYETPLSEYETPADPPGGRHAAPDDTEVIRYAPYGADRPALPVGARHAFHSPDDRHALPSGAAALALPAGSLSADDATQVFARFEDKAVLTMAGSPPLEEVEAETVDDSPAPRPAEDDSIVDAEILDDEPDTPAFAKAASARSWELPAGAAPASPRTDWTVADGDGFFFGGPAEPSPSDTAWIPTPSQVSADMAAMFADPGAPGAAGTAAELAAEPEFEAAEVVAEPDTAAHEPADDEAVAVDEPIAVDEPVTVDEPVDVDEPVTVDEPVDVDEPVTVDEPVDVDEPATVDELVDVERAGPFEPLATVDLRDRVRRPTSLADQMPARRSANTVGSPAELEERDFGQVAETEDRDVQTSTPRPATVGDQALPRRPIPSLSESQPMTEPEPLAPAAPATSAPAGMFTPAPEVPAPYVVHEPPPLRAIPDVVPPAQPAATPVHAPPTPAQPAPAQPTPAQPTPAQPAPARPTPIASAPPSAPPAPIAPAPAATPVQPEPMWTTAAPNAIPAPPRPTPAVAPPNPIPAHPVSGAGTNAMPAAARRPADLADHLRESRPADLADHLRESRPADLDDYTTGRTPRRRRPGEETLRTARRPATLADHLSSRKPADESTADLRDHATQE